MHARLVLPHQLFVEQRDAQADLFLLVEPDLFVRQYPFHTHKLVLHRASMRRFADQLSEGGARVICVDSRADRGTDAQLTAVLREHRIDELSVFDVVDDWLDRDLRRIAGKAGARLQILETPNFLTTDQEVREQLAPARGARPRMATFYQWQRRRLDVLMEGSEPVGGRWSFDTENRKPYPKSGLNPPPPPRPRADRHTADAIGWVGTEFGDNPGDPQDFAWPTDHAGAARWLKRFVDERLADFGPYEDSIGASQPFLFHAVLTPMLNIGLLSPSQVLNAVLGAQAQIPLASLEGFVRQLIGWREYMRGCYVTQGRALRSANRLQLTRELDPGWWDATTGLLPVDTVISRVLANGYAHHIERLMVLGNAMLLLRISPEAAYEWFMAMFIDAYDWVMVPNVYAMSQFASAEAITTKPYVSGSNYLLKMSDFSKADRGADPDLDWALAWDALYWQFVDDHRDGFAANPRTAMAVRSLDRMADDRRQLLAEQAARWLS